MANTALIMHQIAGMSRQHLPSRTNMMGVIVMSAEALLGMFLKTSNIMTEQGRIAVGIAEIGMTAKEMTEKRMAGIAEKMTGAEVIMTDIGILMFMSGRKITSATVRSAGMRVPV